MKIVEISVSLDYSMGKVKAHYTQRLSGFRCHHWPKSCWQWAADYVQGLSTRLTQPPSTAQQLCRGIIQSGPALNEGKFTIQNLSLIDQFRTFFFDEFQMSLLYFLNAVADFQWIEERIPRIENEVSNATMLTEPQIQLLLLFISKNLIMQNYTSMLT